MQKLRIMATFMICLIVMLPIYSASVFAQYTGELRNSNIYGDDGVYGFMKSGDSLKLDVLAIVKDENGDVVGPTANEQLKLKYASIDYGNFMIVEQVQSGFYKDYYNCSFSDGSIITTTGTYSFYIYLYDKENPANELDTKGPNTIVVDDEAPLSTISEINRDFIGNEIINLDYEVQDQPETPAGKCAGIRETSFNIFGYPAFNTTVLNQGDCNKDGIFPWNVTANQLTDGPQKICLQATDRVGNEGEAFCRDFYFDGSSATECKIKLFDKDGKELKYMSSRTDKITIKANISDGNEYIPGVGYSTGEVYADYSDLKEGNQNFKEVKADKCKQQTGESYKWECSWTVDNPKLEEGVNAVDIIINATDDLGNYGICSLDSYPVEEDEEAPVVEEITTDADGYFGYKRWNLVMATIVDAGSGISEENVFANFEGNIFKNNDGETTQLNPDFCIEDSGTYRCYWNVTVAVNQNSVPEEVVVTVYGQDNSGLNFEATGKIYRDFEAPTVISINATNERGTSYFQTDDIVTFILNATETKSAEVNAYADFSEFSTEKNKSTECDEEDGYWICKWVIKLDKVGYHKEDIDFFVYDTLGNLDKKTYPDFEVFAVEPSTRNFYSLLFDKTQPPIDRAVLSSIYGSDSYYVIVPFTLDYIEGQCEDPDNMEIYTPTLYGDQCGEQSGTGVNYNKDESGDPHDFVGFFQFPINPQGYDEYNSVDIGTIPNEEGESTCYLKFVVRCKDTVYNNPAEEENITISIPIIEDPLHPHGPSDALEERAKRIRDSMKGWSFVTSLDDLIGKLQSLCQIKNVLASVDLVIESLRVGFQACEETGIGDIVTAGGCIIAARKLEVIGNAYQNSIAGTIERVLSYACGFLMCEDAGPVRGYGISVGGGWCDDLKGLFGGYGAVVSDSALELARKSFGFSAACLCLPGLTYNINKARQLECWRGICYIEMTQAGIPSVECDNQYHYMQCVYLQGQWLVLLDIIDPFDNIAEIIMNPFAHAWAIAREAFRYGCFTAGYTPPLTTYYCIGHALMLSAESIAQIAKITQTKEFFKPQQQDYCKMLDKVLGEEE